MNSATLSPASPLRPPSGRGEPAWQVALLFPRPPDGADLVMEVVSEGSENRKRDLETKRLEFAAAGIAEYWIVDPQEQRITVLVLDGSIYRVHGEFAPGTQASSVLLPGFSVA